MTSSGRGRERERPRRERAAPPRGQRPGIPPRPARGRPPRGPDRVPDRPALVRRHPFPELLAPAGSAEAYFAAVEGGADAVYLGLPRFSARERAENVTLSQLARILPHARGRGVRVYLALNALLTEAELPEAISLLHQVAPLRPDAVIVADLGLLRIVREFFPGLPIHASTQAGGASLEAVEQLAAMGAQRVILERHLTLAEVRRIVERASVGVEIFVHGAMCYSYSGKCLFSSYLGGKSGNRGACVQPCRRLYGHGEGEEAEAIFSTRDLTLLDRLPELVPLGFAAFKIEGRMRGADYVGSVVSAYRVALDRIRAGNPEGGVAEGTRILASVAGRPPTPGLLGGAEPGEVVAGGESGNVGEPLGAVREVREGWALLSRGTELAEGERLRVQFRADGSGRGFSARAVRAGRDGILVRIPFDVSPGDLLFRTGGAGRAELTRRARREMESAPAEGARFRIRCAGDRVAVSAVYGTFRREYPFRVSGGGPSRRPFPRDAEEILRSLWRQDLPLAQVRIEEEGTEVSFPDLSELFQRAARQFDKEFYLDGKSLRLSILPTLRVVGNREEKTPSVFYVAVEPGRLFRLPRDPRIVPVVEFTKGAARDPVGALRGHRERAWFRLPAPLLESEAPFWRRTVRDAVGKGIRRWIVPDLGHFRLFPGAGPRRPVTLMSDHLLYAFNLGALAELSRLGASRMILPAEASLPALRDVGKYLHGLGVAMAYGAVPLMASRLLPAAVVRGGEAVSPRGERFLVEAGPSGSVVRPGQPYSASGRLHEIRAAGIPDFFADLTGIAPGEEGAILEALLADREIPGTTPFNLARGNF